MFSSPCKHAAVSFAKYQDRSILVISQPYNLVLNEENSQRKLTIRILYLQAAFRWR